MNCLLLLLLILFTEYHLFNLDMYMISLLFVQLLVPINICTCILFFPYTIYLWNNLPDSVVHSNSLVNFKHFLQMYHVFIHPSLLCINFVEKCTLIYWVPVQGYKIDTMDIDCLLCMWTRRWHVPTLILTQVTNSRVEGHG